MSIFPKANYRFFAIPIKITLAFFQKYKKKSEIHMEPQKTINRQISVEQGEQSLRQPISLLKIILQSNSNLNNKKLAS